MPTGAPVRPLAYLSALDFIFPRCAGVHTPALSLCGFVIRFFSGCNSAQEFILLRFFYGFSIRHTSKLIDHF